MPLFNFRCGECTHFEEHFVMGSKPVCPACGSADYQKTLSRTLMIVEYANHADFMENKIDPLVNETYAKIGKEAMSEDTSTLEDLFGSGRVENTFAQDDD